MTYSSKLGAGDTARRRLFGSAWCCLLAVIACIGSWPAVAANDLPPVPAYLGEVRRDASGKS